MLLKKKDNKAKRSSSVKKNKEVEKKDVSSKTVKDNSNILNQGPSVTPYSQEFIDKEYQDYKAFYEDFSRPPLNVKDDKFDAYYKKRRQDVPVQKEYFTGWEMKNTKTGVTWWDTKKPKEKPGVEITRVENKPVGEYQDLAELNRRVGTYAQHEAILSRGPNFLKTESLKNKKKTEAAKKVASKSSYSQYRKIGTGKEK